MWGERGRGITREKREREGEKERGKEGGRERERINSPNAQLKAQARKSKH